MARLGVEEERFNRIKKTMKFPVNAIRACLDAVGCSAADINAVGVLVEESFVDQPIGRWLAKEFNLEVPPNRVGYSPHHLAHRALGVRGFRARRGAQQNLPDSFSSDHHHDLNDICPPDCSPASLRPL